MLTESKRCIVGLRYGNDFHLRTRCLRPLAHAGRHEAFTHPSAGYQMITWVPRDPNEFRCRDDQQAIFAWEKQRTNASEVA